MSPSRRPLLTACLALGLLAGCQAVPADYPREPSWALPAGSATPLTEAVAGAAAPHPVGQSGFRLLSRGPQALAARHALVLAARRTLDLQYYIVGDDPDTRRLLRLVAQAAERGVRVRLLVDDIHSDGRDPLAAALATRPNIEVRVFNPFGVRGPMGLRRSAEFLRDMDRLNRRMHNKAMVADAAVAITGGRNLGEAYFGASGATSFVDLDVLAAGPVARELADAFDAYWNSPHAVPVQAFVAERPDPPPPVGDDASPVPGAAQLAGHLLAGTLPLQWAEASTWWDRPEKVAGEAAAQRADVRIGPRIRQLMLGARRSLTLVSAYLVPGRQGVDEMAGLVDAGVRVRLLTNSLGANDVVAAHGGYARYRPGLVQAGVELFELRPLPRDEAPDDPASGFRSRTSLHAKTMVVDGNVLVVGSFNADPRSVWLNTETVVVIRSEALAADVEAQVDEVAATRCHRVRWQDDRLIWEREAEGRLLRTDVEPDTSVWRRLLARVLGAVAPEGSL